MIQEMNIPITDRHRKDTLEAADFLKRKHTGTKKERTKDCLMPLSSVCLSKTIAAVEPEAPSEDPR